MASLSAHLCEPDDHGRLAFHPQCPLCRGRLLGVLPAEPIMSRRTQALVAAGALALSSAPSSAALAAIPPDTEQEGVAAPDAAWRDAAASPDFAPEGELTVLPMVAESAPAAPDPDDETAPLEDEAATSADGAIVDVGDGSGTPVAPPQAAPEGGEAPALIVAPTPAPAAQGVEPPAPTNDNAATTDAREREAERTRPQPRRAEQVDRAKSRTRAERVEVTGPNTKAEPVEATAKQPQEELVEAPSAAAPTQSIEAPSTLATTPAAPSEPAATPPSVGRQGRAAQGDRAHVVLPGESLWSIAADLVGNDASVAAVAREVNRLWALNEDRIATGDPNLIIAGTRLLLR
jgi:hypothetical protein